MSETNSSLLEEISSIVFLRQAWKALNKSKKDSKGLSNITIEDFEKNLESHLGTISKLLRLGKYKFSPARGVPLKKSGGGFRLLKVGEISDRLVQKALSIKLDALLSDKFNLDNECSFAYRRGRNVNNAIEKMVDYYNQGYKVILEADIKKFFDTVDRKSLIERIKKHLRDSSVDGLIEGALTQEIGNTIDPKIYEEYFADSESGLPQGNALSPLFANIYLSDFDERILREGYKMIRYADDFIIMCKTQQEAEKALEVAIEELEVNLKLKLHSLGDVKDENAKTRIVKPGMHVFSFLSIRFDGNRCWVKEKKVMALLEKVEFITGYGDEIKKPQQLLPMMTSLKNTVEGWIAAYHFVDLDKTLTEIDNYINRYLYLAFQNLGFEVKKSSLTKVHLHRIVRNTDEKPIAFVKGRTNEVLALNKQQRINTGIPSCHVMWSKMVSDRNTRPTEKILVS